MICYEVHLNGRRLCVAGQPGYGVLGANLPWVKRAPRRRRPGEPTASYDREEHSLTVGGLFRDVHVRWVRERQLRVGDVVRFRVRRRQTADEPTERTLAEPRGRLREKKAYLARMERYLPDLRREIRAQERMEREQALVRPNRRKRAPAATSRV